MLRFWMVVIGVWLVVCAIPVRSHALPTGANISFGCNACPGAKYVCADAGWICFGGRRETVGCELNDCDGPVKDGYALQLGYATPAQVDSGYGSVDLEIVGDKLRMVFYRDLEIPSGATLLPIHFDYELGPSISNALGHGAITVKQGNYAVDFTNQVYGEVLLDLVDFVGITSSTRQGLALAGLQPNPGGRGASVVLSLPMRAPAKLEVIDLSGRRVFQRDVGELGSGTHRVRLPETLRLAPGVYVLRLSQDGQVVTTRAVMAS